jgi:hypothetical protein
MPLSDPEEPSEAAGGTQPPRRAAVPRGWKLAGLALALAAAVGGVAAFRAWQERRIVALSMARAQKLVRSDTWLGYREAAALLEVRAARVDPLEAGSLRALALAMLAADYRDGAAGRTAEPLLVAPGRAERVPPSADLATAALALSRGEVGTAVNYAGRASQAALAHVIRARAALVAGNPAAAAESIDRALALDSALPAARALQGDLLRRAGRAADARSAYAAALEGSARALATGLAGSGPEGAVAPHARAAYGLAKLALSRQLPPSDASAPVERLLGDRAGTPGVERARAALHLAALLGREGDRAGAASAIERAGLDAPGRAWLERAAGLEEVERGPYRVAEMPPPSLVSASDDDPYTPPPPPAAAPRTEEAPRSKYPPGFKVHPPSRSAKSNKAGARSKGVR